jgi:hypothetical protein
LFKRTNPAKHELKAVVFLLRESLVSNSAAKFSFSMAEK